MRQIWIYNDADQGSTTEKKADHKTKEIISNARKNMREPINKSDLIDILDLLVYGRRVPRDM